MAIRISTSRWMMSNQSIIPTFKRNTKNIIYFNTFKALVEIMEHHGRNIANDDVLIDLDIGKACLKQDTNTMQADELVMFTARSRDKALAITFLK